jgi:hypothetical protein
MYNNPVKREVTISATIPFPLPLAGEGDARSASGGDKPPKGAQLRFEFETELARLEAA